MDIERILFQIMGKDNWEAVDEIESFLWVFDHMPPQMKLIVDFKLQGHTNKEIAKIMSISVHNVGVQLNLAKKRICRSFV